MTLFLVDLFICYEILFQTGNLWLLKVALDMMREVWVIVGNSKQMTVSGNLGQVLVTQLLLVSCMLK
jgi:hypothetical protein